MRAAAVGGRLDRRSVPVTPQRDDGVGRTRCGADGVWGIAFLAASLQAPLDAGTAGLECLLVA